MVEEPTRYEDVEQEVHPKQKQGDRGQAAIQHGVVAKLAHIQPEPQRESTAPHQRERSTWQLCRKASVPRRQKGIAEGERKHASHNRYGYVRKRRNGVVIQQARNVSCKGVQQAVTKDESHGRGKEHAHNDHCHNRYNRDHNCVSFLSLPVCGVETHAHRLGTLGCRSKERKRGKRERKA